MKSIKKARIAIVHDGFIEDGGSERVVQTMSEMFPQADIYTFLASNKSKVYLGLKDRITKKILIPGWFFVHASKMKLLAYHYWESLNFDNYDLVISSSHSYSSKNIVTSGRTKHICYCYTPPRYLYPGLVQEGGEHGNFLARGLMGLLVNYLLKKEKIAGQRPNVIIGISKVVSKRIINFYQRRATVVYPPVETAIGHYPSGEKSNYYIYCGRLCKAKFVGLAIQACLDLKKKLVVIGDGVEMKRLRSIAGEGVVILGSVSENEKWEYLSKAKGFIFPAKDEDFGIAPVEAMMAGTAVIAYYGGGPKETVIENKTGLFFREHNVESLKAAILRFEKMEFDPKACIKQAKKFSRRNFEKKLMKIIKSTPETPSGLR